MIWFLSEPLKSAFVAQKQPQTIWQQKECGYIPINLYLQI